MCDFGVTVYPLFRKKHKTTSIRAYGKIDFACQYFLAAILEKHEYEIKI
jgi:hypothetical protein